MIQLTDRLAKTTPIKDPQTLAAQRGSLLDAAQKATEEAQRSEGVTARKWRAAHRAWAELDAHGRDRLGSE